MRLQSDFAMPSMSAIHRGTLYYERGLEVVDISGWMQAEEVAGEAWIIVFADPNRPAWQQRYTGVPTRKVLEVDIEEVIPLECPSEAGTVPPPRAVLQQSPAA